MNKEASDEREEGKSLRELRHEDAEAEAETPDIDEENPLTNAGPSQSAF